jgi:putative hydrolase of the HAD superfamily
MRENKKVILFDLGNTLVQYYGTKDWNTIVEETVGEVRDFLKSHNLLNVPDTVMWQNVQNERHDPSDFRVIPLAERLSRVFGLDNVQDGIKDQMCRSFLKPIFARGRIYDDTVGCLENLRRSGFKIGIVSNTPWGSGGDLWRQELKGLGLLDMVDETIFCTDVGWRKPDRRIFEYTLAKFNAAVNECVFIGDDPRWDIEGPRAIGMDAVLLDRTGQKNRQAEITVHNLNEFVKLLPPVKTRGVGE